MTEHQWFDGFTSSSLRWVAGLLGCSCCGCSGDDRLVRAGRSDIAQPMTVREEIAFSIFVAAVVVMGWKLIVYALDYVLT